MNLVEVATTKPYRVRIGSGAVHELAGLVAGRRAAVVCPQTLVHLVPRFGIDDLVVIEVPDAEAAKTPEVLVNGWRRLAEANICLLYTSPSPRDVEESRMPSSA